MQDFSRHHNNRRWRNRNSIYLGFETDPLLDVYYFLEGSTVRPRILAPDFFCGGGYLICTSCQRPLSSGASFCSDCGAKVVHGDADNPQDDNYSSSASNQTSGAGIAFNARTQPPRPNVNNLACPVCGQIDKTQKVKTIISSGTSQTLGLGGLTPLRDFGNVGLGAFVSSTSTALSKELEGYGVPRGWGQFWSWIWYVLPGSLVSLVAIPWAATDSWLVGLVALSSLWWVAVGVSLALAFYFKSRFERRVLGTVTALWGDAKTRLNEARFCFRDSVIFDESFSGDSANFIDEAFSPVWEEIERLKAEGKLEY